MKHAKSVAAAAFLISTLSASVAQAIPSFNDPTKTYLTIYVTPKTVTTGCSPKLDTKNRPTGFYCGPVYSFTYIDPINQISSIWSSAQYIATYGNDMVKAADQFCYENNHMVPEYYQGIVGAALQKAFPGKLLRIIVNGKMDMNYATIQFPPYIYGCKGDKSYRR